MHHHLLRHHLLEKSELDSQPKRCCGPVKRQKAVAKPARWSSSTGRCRRINIPHAVLTITKPEEDLVREDANQQQAGAANLNSSPGFRIRPAFTDEANADSESGIPEILSPPDSSQRASKKPANLTFKELLAYEVSSISKRRKAEMEAHLPPAERRLLRKARFAATMKSPAMLSGYLSVPELLELDIHSLTRIQKRNLEAHLSPDEKEALRRARISIKQVGARPWNAGLPSSEGTKERIRKGVTEAMKRPEVLERLKLNHGPKVQPKETRDKISRTLRKRFASNREGIQDLTEKSTRGQAETAIEWLHSLEMGGPFLPESVRAFAKLMPSDILSKDRLAEKATSNLLVEHFPAARLKRIISAAQKVLARTGAESDAPLSDVSSGTAVSREDVAELTKIQIVGEPTAKQNSAAEFEAQPTAKQKGTGQSANKPKSKSSKATRNKKDEAEKISSNILDRLKEQEMAMIEKQSQQAAKLTVAKNLVFELEGVLAFLPHESDLGPGDADMKQSIIEAEELLAQAKKRVQALEAPFLTSRGSPSQAASSSAQLQSAMVMLNMDSLE